MKELVSHLVLGIRVCATDYEGATRRIIEAARQREPLAVSALAVHGLMTGVLDAEQRYRLNHLDLVLPDGQPVRWVLNSLHQTGLKERVYGPALMLRLLEAAAAAELPVGFFGATPATLQRLAQTMSRRFPGLCVAGTWPSQFRALSEAEDAAFTRTIMESGAAIVLVGLGCPLQEIWVYEHRNRLSMPLVAVGAAFDFLAGVKAQAPAWMQQAGLEWLFRLHREPRRLWRRYLFLNPLFLVLWAARQCGWRGLDVSEGRPPRTLRRPG